MTLARAVGGGVIGLLVAACSMDVLYPPPTPLPAQPACAETGPEALCVLVLGDSIGAGVPLEGDDRWWVQLERDLQAALPDAAVSVESWAVPSSRVDVLESAASDQPALGTFDVAIVVEGVNDVGRTPVDEWAARYADAVERIEAQGLTVVMAAPPPNFEDGKMQARHDEVDAVVRGLAQPTRPVLDIAGRFRADGDALAPTYYADNLHQGAAGQRVIADLARDAVLGVLRADGR